MDEKIKQFEVGSDEFFKAAEDGKAILFGGYADGKFLEALDVVKLTGARAVFFAYADGEIATFAYGDDGERTASAEYKNIDHMCANLVDALTKEGLWIIKGLYYETVIKFYGHVAEAYKAEYDAKVHATRGGALQ